jgi:DNA-binding FadR family transcriptional regulator
VTAVDGETPLIGSVRATATYELVVEQVRRALYLGRFLPGDKLPPERDLASQMGVSRTTIREAVRVLEGEGLVTVRRGATGGLVVLGQAKLTPSQVKSYMETQRGLLDSVFEFRLANECAAASLAAGRRTEAHLKRLARALEEMDRLGTTAEARERTGNIARFSACDSEFHLAIAQASLNPFLVKAVEDARTAMFLPIGRVFTRLEDNANEHHAAIFEAVRDRDATAAAAHMRAHIEATRTALHGLLPKPKKPPPPAG